MDFREVLWKVRLLTFKFQLKLWSEFGVEQRNQKVLQIPELKDAREENSMTELLNLI